MNIENKRDSVFKRSPIAFLIVFIVVVCLGVAPHLAANTIMGRTEVAQMQQEGAGYQDFTSTTTELNLADTTYSIVLKLIQLVFLAFVMAALLSYLNTDANKNPLVNFFTSGFKKYFSALGALLLQTIATIAVQLIVIFVAGGILLLIFGGSFLGVIVAILIAVATVVVQVLFMFVVYEVIIFGTPISRSISESYEKTKSIAVAVFFTLIILGLIIFGLSKIPALASNPYVLFAVEETIMFFAIVFILFPLYKGADYDSGKDDILMSTDDVKSKIAAGNAEKEYASRYTGPIEPIGPSGQ